MNGQATVRVWLLTGQALREAVHLKLAWALVAAALAMTGAAALLREFNFGAEEARFLSDLAEGALALFGVLLAIALPLALFHLRPARDTIGVLQMHCVRRHEWLISRAVAAAVAVIWLAVVVQGLLALLLWRTGHKVVIAELVAAGGISALRLVVVTWLAALMCTLCRGPLLAASLALALTFALQLAPVISWAQQHGSGVLRWGWQALDWALPDFPKAGFTGVQLACIAGYGVLYLAVACWTFSRREL